MGFFTRLPLNDEQTKQVSGDTLTLSGETNFSGILKSKGTEIDGTLDVSVSSGDTLTWDGSKIRLLPANDAGFDGNRTISRSGVPNINVGGTTIKQFVENFFFPDQDPTATLTASNNDRLFGDDSNGTLTWTVTRTTYPITGITVNNVVITGVTGNDQNDTQSYSVSTGNSNPSTGTTQTTETFEMEVVDNQGNIGEDSAVVTWNHKRLWFKSSTLYSTTNSGVLETLLNDGSGLIGSELSTTEVKEFNPITFSGEYFYYVYPVSFGVPSFVVNGLPNNAWGVSPSTLFIFDFTNENGYTEQFYIARSDSKLSTTFNIKTI